MQSDGGWATFGIQLSLITQLSPTEMVLPDHAPAARPGAFFLSKAVAALPGGFRV
jgi:hypothetical protein